MIKNPKIRKRVKNALVAKVIVGLGVVVYLTVALWSLHINKQNMRDATYTVVVTGRGSGTGVVVKSDETGSILITNKHVCDIALQGKPQLNSQGGTPVSTYVLVTAKASNGSTQLIGQVLEVAANADLCAVHLMEKDLKTVKIAKRAPRIGERIMSHGSPLGMEDVTSNGRVLGHHTWHHMKYMTAKISVRPGSSGSGVYNSKGELIGIISWGQFESNVAGFVQYEHMMLFLARFGIK